MRRPWLGVAAAAASTAACVAGAVLVPSSWWALPIVAAYVTTMVLARDVAPEAYRLGWPRATTLTSLGVAIGAASYAFAVEPLGPRPTVAILLGAFLAAGVAGLVGGTLAVWRGGEFAHLAEYDAAVRRSDARWD